VSIDGAKRFRLYENARELTGQVVSITEASRVPPRFDLTISWSDGPSAERTVIRTGPKAVDDLKEGQKAIEAAGGEFFFDLGEEGDEGFERKFRDPDGIIFDINDTGWTMTSSKK